jgi:hypothetical protein
VDPVSVSALVALLSKIFDGMAGRTGEQLWDSLTTLVRRVFGRRSTSVEAVKRLGERPGDRDAIRALAEALAADAARDPQAGAQLRHWAVAAERTISDSTYNTVSGTVYGNVIQARDIHGDINL